MTTLREPGLATLPESVEMGGVDAADPPVARMQEPHRQRARIPSDASRRFVEMAARRARRRPSDALALLDSILLDASDLLRASRVAIMLYDPEQKTVEILDIGSPAFPGRIVRLGEGVAGRVIQSGHPLVIEDYENWPGKISGEVKGPPIVSAVGVPLHSGPMSIGALTLHSTDPGRRFSMSDAHVLELFADIAMLALSHASLYEEVRLLNRRLERRVRLRTKALERSTEEISRKNEQLEELLANIGKAQNEERRRIAQDIHDGVMQTLTGAVYELKALETANRAIADLAPELSKVRSLLHQLEVELRGVIQDVQPVELENGGLLTEIEEYATNLRVRFGIHCRVRVVGRRLALEQTVEVAALRIIKEALRNAQIHASPTLVGVEITFRPTELGLVVRDDGVGFDLAAMSSAGSHLGISGMRRRAEMLGGAFTLDSKPGGGTVIRATLPVRR